MFTVHPLRNGADGVERFWSAVSTSVAATRWRGAFVVDGGASPIAFDVEFEDGGPVHQAVDGSDAHGGLGEDLVRLAERLVGA